MKFDKPKVASVLQLTSPTLIILYEAITFPAIYADAQRFSGPPYYLPFQVFVGLLCTSLFFTAFLLWRRNLVGWLLSILLDGAVAIFVAYFIISDRLGKWPMPVWIDVLLAGVGALCGAIPVLLLSQQSFAAFRITTTAAAVGANLNFSESK